jgi:hypothetical protein
LDLEADLAEAVVAVDGPGLSRFERNLGRGAAFGADDIEHAARPLTLESLRRPALRAALRLIQETFLLEEALLARCPDEVSRAIATPQRNVLESHWHLPVPWVWL